MEPPVTPRAPEPARPRSPEVAHVGIAVTDLEQALAFYRDVLGLTPHPPETVDGATIVSLSFGDAQVELLHPLTPDSPVGRFLAKRGPGIHHLCYRVPDLDQALETCRRQGYRLVDQAPRLGAGGRRIAFLHPSTTAGILIELTE
ncbi:MAG: methylmalonyl-CoA epimerase [Gemmatimonadetes bacterium]|nr:methylmalonyl-CoA epimerase [Gemmatimonadota bacterium]